MFFIMFVAIWPKLLDISVAVGVLGIIAKASELILDSHQQKQFQQFMERLTEHLIDVNVVKWYPRLRQLSFNIPIFAFVIAVEWFIFSRLGRNPRLTEHLHTLHADGWRVYVSLASWQFIMYLVIVHFLARIRRPFTFCISTLVPILVAVPFFILSLFAFMGWAVFIGTVYKNDPRGLDPTTFMIVLYGVVGLLAVATLWFWLSVVLCGMGVAVTALWLLTSFLRELFWRMTTYAKGAWAAAWIMLTAILGIIDFISKK
jgi:hypothetical protein